jgi:hypothetical protein
MLSLNRLHAGKQLLQQIWAQGKQPSNTLSKQGILGSTQLPKNSLPPKNFQK